MINLKIRNSIFSYGTMQMRSIHNKRSKKYDYGRENTNASIFLCYFYFYTYLA